METEAWKGIVVLSSAFILFATIFVYAFLKQKKGMSSGVEIARFEGRKEHEKIRILEYFNITTIN